MSAIGVEVPADYSAVGNRLRPLVLDDDLFTNAYTAYLLRQCGVQDVYSVTEGERALELLDDADTAVNLLICDLRMEGMDGVECLRALGARQYTGSVIVVSGADPRVLASVRRLAGELGLNLLGVAQKPLQLSVLEEMLRRLEDPSRSRAPTPPVPPYRSLTAQSLQHAIAADELTVQFQPKVPVLPNGVLGAECLLRWLHPEYGYIPPPSVINLAESSGLLRSLTRWIFVSAIHALGDWSVRGYRGTVSINLSMCDVAQIDLPEMLADLTSAAGLLPTRIILELTESEVMQDAAASLDVIARLRLKGFGLSIDDFGTGYSSMELLKVLPFTELKIDRSFVAGATVDPVAAAILRSSVKLAHDLQMTAVAEGAETEAERELAVASGCDEVQGYVLARPMPGEAFLVWALNWQAAAGTGERGEAHAR